MKRYIRAIICLIYSLVKFSIMKIFHFKRFEFTIYNLISPFTEIDISKNGKFSIGKLVKIRSGSKLRVRKSGEIKIGQNTSLNHGCIFTAHEKITIGQNVQFGPNVLIYDHDHDFREKDGLKNLKYKTAPIIIGDNVWIGANVIILRGTSIGDNCVIGAGSVIKGNYSDNTLIIQKKDTVIKNMKKISGEIIK